MCGDAIQSPPFGGLFRFRDEAGSGFAMKLHSMDQHGFEHDRQLIADPGMARCCKIFHCKSVLSALRFCVAPA
ncbi:hypothetical protein B0E46_13630 [Rhodanobacter sp. B04]|nr:hypothetical protein B0E46_13630 [Rhodanobacter sp. B04]